MPLLAGFMLPPLEAAAAAFVGGVLTVLAASATAGFAPYSSVNAYVLLDPLRAVLVFTSVRAAFLNPTTWIALAGWPVSALLMSALCRRATRASAVVGALLGTGALVGAHVLAREASLALGRPAAWTNTAFGVSVAASLILMLVIAALGAPLRPEEEGALEPALRAAPLDQD
jgi:hypothetical protein